MILSAASEKDSSLLRSGLVLVTLLLCNGNEARENDPADPGWRAFQMALGEPALIGANADHAMSDTAFRPVPAFDKDSLDVARFQLGFTLFHDGRLSSDGRIACITCHAGPVSAVDGRRVSRGVDGASGTLNALSLFNAAFNFRQFWDGRSVTLEEQALEPIITLEEMAHSLDAVEAMLENDSRYPERFARVYPDGISIANMSDAMAYFQRVHFIRRDTPFQQQLQGQQVLDAQALHGWSLFENLGCVACHNGVNLGGNSYQALGSLLPYYDQDRPAAPADDGLAGRSGREYDRHVFRVPGLHGVAVTAPYFHDGSVARLETAILEMGEHQLGIMLNDSEVTAISAFLRSTTGTYDGSLMRQALNSPIPGASSAVSTVEVSHHEAYADVIDRFLSLPEQLIQAAHAIHHHDVANYDHLQFIHLEMIRHARALQHPPSWLDTEQAAQLTDTAGSLLDKVYALEWIISDFLRAEAQRRALSAVLRQPEERRLIDEEALRRQQTQWKQQAEALFWQLQNTSVVQQHDELKASFGKLEPAA